MSIARPDGRQVWSAPTTTAGHAPGSAPPSRVMPPFLPHCTPE
jgi:hypothetical protein